MCLRYKFYHQFLFHLREHIHIRRRNGYEKEFLYQLSFVTTKLTRARQTYRNFLREIIETGIEQKIFLDRRCLNVELAINSIVGTVNWSIYNSLIVREESLDPDRFIQQLLPHLLRSLKV